MSGGVDSAVAAALLKEAGYDVIGVTLILWKEEEGQVRWQDRSCCKVGLARHVAKLLDIPHYVMDHQTTFQKEVIDDFCDTYLAGQTPNPCVRCNERVKFGRLLEIAKQLGADYFATGHYARLEYIHGRYHLYQSMDTKKDQSYFLYRLRQEQLAPLLFPLGTMHKEAVYQKAEALGLPYEDILESQEVCFVTQKDYRAFLREHHPESIHPGAIVTTLGEVVGKHEGIAFYTIGQRRGLGIALGERTYVTALRPETNEVVVGQMSQQETLMVKDVVWGGGGVPSESMQVQARIRYRATPKEAELTPLSQTRAHLRFQSPQPGTSPGQSVVFYQGDCVVGGGIIS